MAAMKNIRYVAHIKIGPLYFYVSTCRLKRRSKREDEYRNYRKELIREKVRRWKSNGGCCEACGQKKAVDDLEIHHVMPVSERPDLIGCRKNIKLLCHECHQSVHHPQRTAV